MKKSSLYLVILIPISFIILFFGSCVGCFYLLDSTDLSNSTKIIDYTSDNGTNSSSYSKKEVKIKVVDEESYKNIHPYKPELAKAINELVSLGFIARLDTINHKVYVDHIMWISVDPETKEKLSYAIAEYVAMTGNDPAWIDIYDNQSGRKIASIDGWHGFRVY